MRFLKGAILAAALALASTAHATLLDLKIGEAQIFDVQYSYSGTTLNVRNMIAPYESTGPGGNFAHPSLTAGQYYGFINSPTVAGTYGMAVFNGDGTQAYVIHNTGSLSKMGDGVIFYVGNNFFGTVISTSQGYAYGSSASFTNTHTPTATEIANYTPAASVPLAAGQTAASVSAPAPAPTVTGTTTTNAVATSTAAAAPTTTSTTTTRTVTGTDANGNPTVTTYRDVTTVTQNRNTVTTTTTPTTVTTYSDGTTTTTTGTPVVSSSTVNTGSPTSSTATNLYSTAVTSSVTTVSTAADTPVSTATALTRAVSGTDANGHPTVTTYYDVTTTVQNRDIVTTTVTPVTVTTFADGTSTTSNGTATVTTQTVNNGSAVATTASTLQSVATTVDVVTTNSTSGVMTPTTVVTRGAPTIVVEQTDTRDRKLKVLDINRNITTTTTVPVTTTVTQTTPITTVTTVTPTTTTVDASGNVISVTTATPTVTSSTVDQIVVNSSTSPDIAVNSVDSQYQTRIDQMAKLERLSSVTNTVLDSDPLTRSSVVDGRIASRDFDDKSTHVYINAVKGTSTLADTYTHSATVKGVGIEQRIDRGLLIGVQYNQVNASLDGGATASGQLDKNVLGLYTVSTFDDWIVKNDFGRANNLFTTMHTLPELSAANYVQTRGRDTWLNTRLYTPEFAGFRVFAGGRLERNQRDYAVESGNWLTAVDYDAVNKTTASRHVGLWYEAALSKNWILSTELARNSLQTTTGAMAIAYRDENGSSIMLKLGGQLYDQQVARQVQLQGRINF